MTSHEALFDTQGSGFHIVGSEAFALNQLQIALEQARPSAVVRRIRGGKSRTRAAFFDEIAAALQFPYYFGENWHAFNDMILTLGWLEATAYVLLFADAHLLLDAEPPADLAALTSLLAEAHAVWQPVQDQNSNMACIPFHVVFQAPQAELPALQARLSQAGVVFDPAWPTGELDTAFPMP